MEFTLMMGLRLSQDFVHLQEGVVVHLRRWFIGREVLDDDLASTGFEKGIILGDDKKLDFLNVFNLPILLEAILIVYVLFKPL